MTNRTFITTLFAAPVLTLFAVVLFGCEAAERTRTITEYDCNTSTAQDRAEFILDCLEAGNPKSDEEPEDWIPLCMRKADQLFCKKRKFVVTETKKVGGFWTETHRRPLAPERKP